MWKMYMPEYEDELSAERVASIIIEVGKIQSWEQNWFPKEFHALKGMTGYEILKASGTLTLYFQDGGSAGDAWLLLKEHRQIEAPIPPDRDLYEKFAYLVE